MRRNLRGYGYFDFQYNFLVFKCLIVVFQVEVPMHWYWNTTYLCLSTNRWYSKPHITQVPNFGALNTHCWYDISALVITMYQLFVLISNQLMNNTPERKTQLFNLILFHKTRKTLQGKRSIGRNINDGLVFWNYLHIKGNYSF